jgi:ABC-type Fe3+ transport system permease subunit
MRAARRGAALALLLCCAATLAAARAQQLEGNSSVLNSTDSPRPRRMDLHNDNVVIVLVLAICFFVFSGGMLLYAYCFRKGIFAPGGVAAGRGDDDDDDAAELAAETHEVHNPELEKPLL